MDIQEVNTNIEKLEKSRTDLMSFIGAEVAKHPSLKKAFEDLELVNGSLNKCREEKDKLEKAAAGGEYLTCRRKVYGRYASVFIRRFCV